VYLHILPMSDRSATSMPYAATLLGLKQVYPGQWDTFLLPDLIAAEKVTLTYPHQLFPAPHGVAQVRLGTAPVGCTALAMPGLGFKPHRQSCRP
jgi:hypothetical protein